MRQANTSWEAYQTRVWVAHPTLGFAPARVVRTDETAGTLTVEASDGHVLQVSKHACSSIHPNSLTGVPDLLELGEFSLAALLHNVRTRYEKGEYYSSIGLPILISVNPYKPLPHLYDAATRRRYQSAQFLLLSPPSCTRSPRSSSTNSSATGSPAPLLFTDNPHLFGTAQMTYTSLMRNQQAQSIVVSGESGAGKTEATKILLRYFSELDETATATPSLPSSNVTGRSGGFSLLTPKLTAKLSARSPGQKRGSAENISIELHALRSNPVLEAFGNAKTLRNDNSSRFGKFIQIFFDLKNRRRIRKAKISHYLLEKCRLVSLHPSEKNFHVFYALMYGGRRTYLHKLDQWDLLDDSPFQKMLGDEPINEEHEVDMFEELLTCLSSIGFDQNEIDLLFGIVAALLHLSIVSFTENPDKSSAFVPNVPLTTIENLEPLKKAAELLGITKSPPENSTSSPLDSFIHMFTWGKVRDASGVGSSIPTKRDVSGAAYVRDAIVKETYSRLFEWLVRKINFTLCLKEEAERRSMITNQAVRKASKLMESMKCAADLKGSPDLFHTTRSPVTSHVATSTQSFTTPPIGLLDIYGFEVFEGRNSFEQLCINYANEKLQQHFNHHVLSLEQKTYKEEGIDWSDILFTDNKHIIEALEGRLDGVFNLLDSATLAPSADQTYFLREIEATRHKDVVQVLSSKGQRKRFIIVKHYAGEVDYDTDKFVEKNKDKLSHECTYYLGCTSSNTLVTQLFPALPSAITTRSNSLKATVSLEFRTQLSGLLSSLTATTPTYVRCIKPNSSKAPHKFDSIDVLRQLKYAGLLESIRIRNSGFGVRCTFEEFLDKYALLDVKARKIWRANRRLMTVPECGRLCETILSAIIPLNITASTPSSQSSLSVTSGSTVPMVKPKSKPGARTSSAKRAWQSGQTRVFMKEEVQIHLEKSRATVMAQNVIRIQAVWRGRMFRLAYVRSRGAIIRLQRSWRRSLQIRRLVKVWRCNVAYIRIRQWTRWMLFRRRRRRAIAAIRRIQLAWRRHLFRRRCDQRLRHPSPSEEDEIMMHRETTKGSSAFKETSTMESFQNAQMTSSHPPGSSSKPRRPQPAQSIGQSALDDSSDDELTSKPRLKSNARLAEGKQRRRSGTITYESRRGSSNPLASSNNSKPGSRRDKYYECDLFNLERAHQRKVSQLKADVEKYRGKLAVAQQQMESQQHEIESLKMNLQKRESLLVTLIQKNDEAKSKRIFLLARLQRTRDAHSIFEKIIYDLHTTTEEDRWRQTASQCPDLNGFMKYVRACCYQARETMLQAEQSLTDPLITCINPPPPSTAGSYHDYYYVDPFGRYPGDVYDLSPSEFEHSLLPLPSQSVYGGPPPPSGIGSCALGAPPSGVHSHSASRSKWGTSATRYGSERGGLYFPSPAPPPAADVVSWSTEAYGHDYPRRHRYGHRSSLSQQQHHSPTTPNTFDEMDPEYLQHVLSQTAPRTARHQEAISSASLASAKMSPPLHHHSAPRSNSGYPPSLNRYPVCSHDPTRSASRTARQGDARTPSHHERVLSCNVDQGSRTTNIYRQNSSDEGNSSSSAYHRCPPPPATYRHQDQRPPKSSRPTPTHRVSNSLRLPRSTSRANGDEAYEEPPMLSARALPPSRALLHRRSSGAGGSSSEAGPTRSPARATQTPLFVQPQSGGGGGPFLILDGKSLAGRDAANPGSTTSSVKMRCVQKGYHALTPPLTELVSSTSELAFSSDPSGTDPQELRSVSADPHSFVALRDIVNSGGDLELHLTTSDFGSEEQYRFPRRK